MMMMMNSIYKECTQLTFTFSKLAIEAPEEYVKSAEI